MKYFLFLFSLTLIVASCAKAPDFPREPFIEFREVRNYHIAQTDMADTIVFTVYFEDGDGDLRPDQNGSPNVFLRDQRDSSIAFSFASPPIPTEGSGNGIRGTLELRASFLRGDICCLYESGQPPCTPAIPMRTDTVYYDLFLFDEAGHQSNTITAGPIFIRCD